MLRVAFVLRSTEVHPEFCGLSSLIILSMLVLLGFFIWLSLVLGLSFTAPGISCAGFKADGHVPFRNYSAACATDVCPVLAFCHPLALYNPLATLTPCTTPPLAHTVSHLPLLCASHPLPLSTYALTLHGSSLTLPLLFLKPDLRFIHLALD